MMCDLCKEERSGLTWLANGNGRLKVCSDCIDDLAADKEALNKATGPDLKADSR
jgi:hypothetical protein